MAAYAVTVAVEVATAIDDDTVDRLQDNLAPYSGALAASAPGMDPATVEMTLDISAADPGAAATAGLATARRLLAAAGLPADGTATAVHVTTVDEQEHHLSDPVVPALLGLSEVSELFGVARQRVAQLRRRPDFPTPVAELRAGPVWTEPSLRHFLADWDRSPGRRPRTPASARPTRCSC